MTIFKARVAKTLNLRHGLTNSDLEIMLIHLGRDKSAIIYDTQVGHIHPGVPYHD